MTRTICTALVTICLALSGIAHGQILYVASNDNSRVLTYDSRTGTPLGAFDPANLAGLDSPTGLVFGPDRNLYVASAGTNQVLKYDPRTRAFIAIFTSGGTLDEPKDIVFGPDGNLYVASSGNGSVQKFNGTTGAFISIFVAAGSGGLTTPTSLAFGPDGNLYVTDPDNNFVLRFNGTNGTFLSTFVPAGIGGLCEPQGLVFGPGKILYVASGGDTADGNNCGANGTDSVLKYDAVTGAFLGNFVASGSGGLTDPVGVVFGPDGNLYVASEDDDSVRKYDGVSGAFISTLVPTGGGGLSGPNFLAFAPFDSSFQVRYVSNLAVGDSVVNITNSGASGASLQSGTTAGITGAICVNVYAFTPDEQLVSCCSCPVTPNGLVSLSAKNDLASNTLTPAVPTALVIKLLATAPVLGSCSNSAASVTTVARAQGMLAWSTTIHATPAPGTFGVTETPFSIATLSTPTDGNLGELGRLGQLCNFITANGSGFGVCRSCRLGGLGSVRQ